MNTFTTMDKLIRGKNINKQGRIQNEWIKETYKDKELEDEEEAERARRQRKYESLSSTLQIRIIKCV